MTYEEKCKLIEAADLLKKHCNKKFKDYEECDCPFSIGDICRIGDSCPNAWEIPRISRWSLEDVALAKALKDAGAEVIYKSDGKVSLRTYNIYDYGLLPDTVFKNMLSGESIDIDDIIKESEENE